jgi:hypothetical protein
MREAASAHSGTEHIDMASGLIRVTGSVWQVNVDAQVKLQGIDCRLAMVG